MCTPRETPLSYFHPCNCSPFLQKMTLLLAGVTLVSTFGSSFQYGYNVSVINSPAVVGFYNQTYLDRKGIPMESSFQTLLWSLTVSMYPLGGFFGSLMVGPLVNKCGRKGTLLINNVFSIVPAILMGTSKVAKTFEVIILSRIIVGICAGLSSNVVPMYLGEMSPKNLRGAVGVVPQLFITIGILIAQILGLTNILGNVEGWPVLLGLTGIPAVVELLLLPFFPESPRYLLIQKGNEEQARQALKKLRGWDDVDDEIEEMRQEDQSEKLEGRLSVFNLCTFQALRWQLISIIVMMMGQQLSGINAVGEMTPRKIVRWTKRGPGFLGKSRRAVLVFIVESLGRRLLLLVGFGICCVSCPIPFVMITEMFLQSSRPAAFMVGGSVHWLCNFTVGLVFLYMVEGLGAYCFLVFCAICLATFIYIFIIVPETKGKTFMEINQSMAKRNKVEIQMDKEKLNDFQPTLETLKKNEEGYSVSGL
uniref:Solute carrier family 2, facilitated glucose transporter member 5 n=1 Tax=Chelonoidis abingdonii TaxID=106734 RepID=A0A8C0IYF5_CHEAB